MACPFDILGYLSGAIQVSEDASQCPRLVRIQVPRLRAMELGVLPVGMITPQILSLVLLYLFPEPGAPTGT